MALWIQNISPEGTSEDEPHTYNLNINRRLLCTFTHVRSDGAAECLRAAADALDDAEWKEAMTAAELLSEKGK